jgi:hypothetical protein
LRVSIQQKRASFDAAMAGDEHALITAGVLYLGQRDDGPDEDEVEDDA